MQQPSADDMIARNFENAKKTYALWGIDVEKALATLASIPLSLHCWQGDDVGGFESAAGLTGGGIQATGNYPGKARTAEELRADYEVAFSLIPGQAQGQPPRHLRGNGRPESRARRAGTRALRRLDLLGEEARHRAGFQRDLLQPPHGGLGLHPFLPGQEGARFLGESFAALPRDRRGHGKGARHSLHRGPLDRGRVQGLPGGPAHARARS